MFKCDQCEREFAKKMHLGRHLSTTHGQKTPQSKRRKKRKRGKGKVKAGTRTKPTVATIRHSAESRAFVSSSEEFIRHHGDVVYENEVLKKENKKLTERLMKIEQVFSSTGKSTVDRIEGT